MKRLLVLCAAALLVAAPALATPITLTLTPPVEAGLPGGDAIYEGTLANFGALDLFLNDISVTFDAPGDTFLTHDSNFFFANVPGLFAVGDPAYAGPIFRVTLAPDTPAGAYFGTLTLLGGDDFFALEEMASAQFELDVPGPVSAVPEPATLFLVAIGLIVAAARRRRTEPKT